MQTLLIASAITGFTTWLLLFALLKSGLAWQVAVDKPNERSLHSFDTPRVGGLVLVGTALLAISIAARSIQFITVIAVALMLVSAIDDRRGLTVAVRLISQLIAATIAAYALLPASSWWVSGLMVVILVWSMNLYNFMDGVDGLAGGMAVFGFGALSIAAESAGSREIAVASACIAGSAAGFLPHNFPPARVFLGDAGSIPLGFLAAAIGVTGWKQGIWPPWLPALVFSPFIVDATVTVVHRGLRGERVWQAHREHLYQRMVAAGLGHLRTVGAWYGLMAIVIVSAVAAVRWWPIHWQIALLVAWATIYSVLYLFVGRIIASRRK